MEGILYLDTRAVVWLYAGDLTLFPENALMVLKEKDPIISPMVLFELQCLLETKRIKVKPEKILAGLKEAVGLKICRQNFDKIILGAIKQSWTRDPFDRIIAAQATSADAYLMTKDETILKHYKKAIWSKS